MMDLKEKIKAEIESRVGIKTASILNANLKKCLQFDAKGGAPIRMGDSKVGGNPHLPPGASIPLYDGRQLKFLVQFNCKDFSFVDGFPDEGTLYFFIDLTDGAAQFPNKRGQYKVLYHAGNDTARLACVNSDLIPAMKEERLVPVPYYSIPNFDSYLFEDLDLSDDEKDQLIEIKFGVIPEIIGAGGLYSVDITPDHSALYEWTCQRLCIVTDEGVVDWRKLEDEKLMAKVKHEIQNTQKDWVTLFESTLEYVGFPDCWIHIGIHKNDLSARNFDEAVAAFVST